MSTFTAPAGSPSTLKAVCALLVYEHRDRVVGNAQYILASHLLHQDRRSTRVGSGRLLGASERQRLLDVLSNTSQSSNHYLEPEILSHSTTQIAWYMPGAVRKMWFRVGNSVQSVRVPWPTLVFCARPRTLSIAALNTPARPRADAKLFHAPLMNVHANTQLCTGSSPLPEACSLSARNEYEAIVFDTNFSHVNHDRTLKLNDPKAVDTKHHLKFWREAHAAKLQVFPTKSLVALNLTLARWLAQGD